LRGRVELGEGLLLGESQRGKGRLGFCPRGCDIWRV
jgi:hypothetical protein